eukprot:4139331-Amphidinium_carterae.1
MMRLWTRDSRLEFNRATCVVERYELCLFNRHHFMCATTACAAEKLVLAHEDLAEAIAVKRKTDGVWPVRTSRL